MIAKLSIDRLLAKFYKAPEYLGAVDSLNLITESGRLPLNFQEFHIVVTVNDMAK